MKRKILLVDDNEMNQDMLSRFLVLYGFDVVVAGDGMQGIELAQSARPDLILMDMSLPVMDGWEATCFLKSSEKTRAIPIVGLTAHAMLGDKERALKAGCDEYETKPIDFPRLLKKLDGILHTDSAGFDAQVSRQG